MTTSTSRIIETTDTGPEKHEKSPMDLSAPDYHRPTHGIFNMVPDQWIPYLELGRFHKTTGIYLFYFPHLFGVLFAAALDKDNVSIKNILTTAGTFFVGTVFLRSAACAWNDYCDIEYDRQVKRCRVRPLARAAITPFQGLLFTISQTLLAAGVLACFSQDVIAAAIPSIVLMWFYPFAKRITDFPQLILGVQMAWGFFLGVRSMGVPYSFVSFGSLLLETRATWFFYTNCICWTIIYDTIYAQQDIEDDIKAGVKSMAVRFQGRIKEMLSVAALVQVTCIIYSGVLAGMGPFYFSITCGGVAMSLAMEVWMVDLKSPENCLWWFSNGFWSVGMATSIGLLGEYFAIGH